MPFKYCGICGSESHNTVDCADLNRCLIECNFCDWHGHISAGVWFGDIGPLCPECNETTGYKKYRPFIFYATGGANMATNTERPMTEYIYEICDTSDDEMYYPVGIYLSLDDAKTAIEIVESEGEKLSEYAEDYEEITVRERKIGLGEHGKDVLVVHREHYYDEDKDEYLWRRVDT